MLLACGCFNNKNFIASTLVSKTLMGTKYITWAKKGKKNDDNSIPLSNVLHYYLKQALGVLMEVNGRSRREHLIGHSSLFCLNLKFKFSPKLGRIREI